MFKSLHPLDTPGQTVTRCVRGGVGWLGYPGSTPRRCRSKCTVPPPKKAKKSEKLVKKVTQSRNKLSPAFLKMDLAPFYSRVTVYTHKHAHTQAYIPSLSLQWPRNVFLSMKSLTTFNKTLGVRLYGVGRGRLKSVQVRIQRGLPKRWWFCNPGMLF